MFTRVLEFLQLAAALLALPALADDYCASHTPNSAGSYTSTISEPSPAPADTFAPCPTPRSQGLFGPVFRPMLMNMAAQRLAAQHICCSSFNETTGMSCRGNVPGYSKSVSFFIPPTYQPGDKTDVTLFFHGLLSVGSGDGYKKTYDSGVLDRFRFDKMAAATGNSHSIVVVPEDDAGVSTFQSAANQRNGFKNFMDSVNGVLAGLTGNSADANLVGDITLAGHSAGNKPVEASLGSPCSATRCYKDQIKAVRLYDASYSNSDFTNTGRPNVVKFMKNSPPNQFTNIYLKSNSSGNAHNARNYEHQFCQSHATMSGCACFGRLGANAGDRELAACASQLEAVSSVNSNPGFIGVNDPGQLWGPASANHWHTVQRYFVPLSREAGACGGSSQASGGPAVEDGSARTVPAAPAQNQSSPDSAAPSSSQMQNAH